MPDTGQDITIWKSDLTLTVTVAGGGVSAATAITFAIWRGSTTHVTKTLAGGGIAATNDTTITITLAHTNELANLQPGIYNYRVRLTNSSSKVAPITVGRVTVRDDGT